MKLGDADREEMYQRISRHAAEGHLDLDELERRVERIAAAGTREEAAAVLVDLPVLDGDPPSPPAARPRWGRGHGDADKPRIRAGARRASGFEIPAATGSCACGRTPRAIATTSRPTITNAGTP